MTLGGTGHKGRPWLAAFGALTVASVLAMMLLPAQEPSARQLGWNTGTLLLPWLLLALVARTLRWSPWVTLGVGLVVFMVVLVLATAAQGLDETGPDRAGDTSSTGGSGSGSFGPGDRTLTAPRRVGEWQDAGRAATRRMTAAYERRAASAPEGMFEGEPVVGAYSRQAGGSVVLVGMVLSATASAQFGEDHVVGAREALAGATGDAESVDLDPGYLGGGLSCSEEVPDVPDAVLCNWLDADTYGQVLVQVPGYGVDEALPVVLDFREAATVD